MSEKANYYKINEVKTFIFTKEQYINLEIEYNRYIIYKEFIKDVETILNLNSYNSQNLYNYDSNSRKLYENKNILDRFILEYINYGLNTIDIECAINYLFFNNAIKNMDDLKQMICFRKMLSEYNEKHIRLTLDKIIRLCSVLLNVQNKYMKIVGKIRDNLDTNNILCCISVLSNGDYIIKYRNYTKVINFVRYVKLIKNYEKPFPYDIIRMLLRYSLFDASNQQWSIGIHLYEQISELYDVSFEMFASPLNFNMSMFCSLFPDTDKIYGSMGNFYNINIDKLLNQNIKGVFFNPPYLPLLMERTTVLCLELLQEMQDKGISFNVISFLPAWLDASYIQSFLTSKFTMFYKIINKGNYVLHEKDKGKIIKGTFDIIIIVMNSMTTQAQNNTYATASASASTSAYEAFNKIIALMKEETLNKSVVMR